MAQPRRRERLLFQIAEPATYCQLKQLTRGCRLGAREQADAGWSLGTP